MSAIELVNAGILMGIVHVLTGPDHLSALATLSGTNISTSRDRGRGGACLDAFLLGIKWGIGHSLGLLIVGSILIVIQEESSSEWIQMDAWWSVVLEGLVGVFMLALGSYGLHKAFRNRQNSALVSIASGDVESLKLKEEVTSRSEEAEVEIVEMGSPDSRSTNSITRMMEDALDECDSQNGLELDPLRRVSETSNEEDDVEAMIQKAAQKTSGGGLSSSFQKYAANRPTLPSARSLLNLHSAPETSITSTNSTKCCFGKCSVVCTTPSLLALAAGLVHGVAGPGGVLGVIPAVQLRDARLAAIYLSVFCLTSTIVMGCFATFYGTFSECLAGSAGARSSGSIRSGGRVFLVEASSAFLSIAVGIIWLVLLSRGKLDDIFP